MIRPIRPKPKVRLHVRRCSVMGLHEWSAESRGIRSYSWWFSPKNALNEVLFGIHQDYLQPWPWGKRPS